MPPTSSFGGALGEGLVSKSANQSTGGLIGQLFGGWNARRQWKYQKSNGLAATIRPRANESSVRAAAGPIRLRK